MEEEQFTERLLHRHVFLHWGGNGGDERDALYKNPELYYIGDETGDLTFTAPWDTNPDNNPRNNPDAKQYGLSFYSFYSPTGTSVPDGGSTLALVGLAIAGLGLARRKLS